MSHNKIKSLKLQRHNESSIKLEDTSIVLVDEIKTHLERVDKSVKHQESLTPLHSTPKRSSGYPSSIHDHPTSFENRVSPILLPCTQDGGNEVAWDWQSPLRKSTAGQRAKTNFDSIGTPKRTKLLQKKRNSNSPLLYTPIKRKLMKNDNEKESIEQFKAEMRALTEQIKTVPKDNQTCPRKNKDVNINISDNELLMGIDIDDFAECETKVFSTKSDESALCKKNETNICKTSLDDLFDDSIEDSMVKCSQEVEEKLRLESCRENSGKTNSGSSNVKDFSWHQQSYTSFLAAKEKSNEGTTANSSSKFAPVTSTKNFSSVCQPQPVQNDPKKSNPTPTKSSNSLTTSGTNEATKSNVVSTTNSALKSSSSSSSWNNNNVTISKPSIKNISATTQNEIFVIPDDSFDDDFFAVGIDDLVDPEPEKIKPIEESTTKNKNDNSESSNRYGKVYVSPHAALPKDDNPRRSVVSTAKRVLLPPPLQSSSSSQKFDTFVGNISNNSKVFPRNASNDNLNPLKNLIAPQSQSTVTSTNQGRKFFKTKSLSTSNFDDSSSSTKNISMSSSKVPKGDNVKNVSSFTSVSTEQQHQSIKPSNTSGNNAWPNGINGNHDNTRMYNFNRNERREDGKVGRLMISQSNEKQQQNGVKEIATGSQWICTPEEIEKKRLEAKMKLEMKRKLQARSRSAGLLSTQTSNGPVKR